jgi:hypothetical protein
MYRIPVIFQGQDYLILFQNASGYCEIIKAGEPNPKKELVHFSELVLKR